MSQKTAHPIEARGRIFKGLRIPRFRAGEGGPQIGSSKDMNVLVDSINSLSNVSISRGESDEVTITDSNTVLQLVPDSRDLSGLRAGSSLAAYWTLDEASGDRIDKVSGLHLILSYTAGGTTRDLSIPGIIGNATEIDTLGGSHNDVDFSNSPPSSKIGIGSNGFSIFGWFNVFNIQAAIPFIEYFWSSNIRIRFTSSTQLVADCVDDNSAGAAQTVSFTTSAWHFYHFFYDSVAQQLGFSLDGVTPTMFGSSLVFAANPSAIFQLHLGDLFSAGSKIAWDETGIVSSKHLSTSQVSSIYNSGAGVTWPAISSIV